MSSEQCKRVHDYHISNYYIQESETGFSPLSSDYCYTRLNYTEPLGDGSSGVCSFGECNDSNKYNGLTIDTNQTYAKHQNIDTAVTNLHTSKDLKLTFLLEMLGKFPDTSLFFQHPVFPLFSRIWIEFQNNILLAEEPANRQKVLVWFGDTISDIHHILINIARPSSLDENLESQSNHMFSALRRLKDRIEIAQKAIKTIENSRVWFNQDPVTTLSPLIEAAEKLNQDDGSYYLTCDSYLTNSSTFELNSLLEQPIQPYQSIGFDDSRNDIQFGFEFGFSSNETNLCNVQNPNLFFATEQLENPVVNLDPSPTESCVSTPPALYIPHVLPNLNRETSVINAATIYQAIEEYTGKYNQINSHEPTLLPHVHPSWVHCSSSWSVPVTPSEDINNIKYMSLPVSPTWNDEGAFSQGPIQEEYGSTACTTFPVSTDSHIVYTQECSDPSRILSHSNSPVSNCSSDDLYRNTEDESIKTSTVEEEEEFDEDEDDGDDDDDDGEYIHEEIFEEEYEKQISKKAERTKSEYRTKTKSGSSSSCSSSPPSYVANTKRKKATRASCKSSTTSKGRSYTRRTATSYDSQTTHYLKSVFFDIYSRRDKLTKDQRRQVQKETGLKPRNITYWFSNHKRRFRYSLIKFKEAVKESKGKIKTYDDFIDWRRSQGLSEEVQASECDVNSK